VKRARELLEGLQEKTPAEDAPHCLPGLANAEGRELDAFHAWVVVIAEARDPSELFEALQQLRDGRRMEAERARDRALRGEPARSRAGVELNPPLPRESEHDEAQRRHVLHGALGFFGERGDLEVASFQEK
jgi:hypothetical protein